ncbi:hypothetical protein [Jannaschia pohangensis]|uniref:Uncharacterized protein n=1 Tax=Jannaschia pohangensis TaxID=390807 RepID=A0A1I3NM28_9RHOB|nr:hypothetical protein [Jannaschia pohangensis]SFJ10239.1 hypothetical protein SAMN04488095_2192 [Jannaschia pohangensis]
MSNWSPPINLPRLELTAWATLGFLIGYLTMAFLVAPLDLWLGGLWAVWLGLFPDPMSQAVARGFRVLRRWLTYGAIPEATLDRDAPVVAWATRMGAVSAFLTVVLIQTFPGVLLWLMT